VSDGNTLTKYLPGLRIPLLGGLEYCCPLLVYVVSWIDRTPAGFCPDRMPLSQL